MNEDGYNTLRRRIDENGILCIDVPINGVYYHMEFIDDEVQVDMPYIGNELYILGRYPRKSITFYYGDKDVLNGFLENLVPCKYHNFGSHDIGCCPADLFQCKEQDTCAICMEQDVLVHMVPIRCGHVFHKECLNNLAKHMLQHRYDENPELVIKCPICRYPMAFLN